MRTRFNRKYRTVHRTGDFDSIRQSWLNESLRASPNNRTLQRRPQRVRGNVAIQKRGSFYFASIATKGGIVRGIDTELFTAVGRAKILANGLQGENHG
jgi:hypothetical protein